MPKLALRQKPVAAAQAEVRTLGRSEKYGVVGTPLFPGIDVQVDTQIAPQFDSRRDVFDRIDKAKTDRSSVAGGARLIDNSLGGSSSIGTSAPQLKYVKLDDAFFAAVLRWAAGQQDNDVFTGSASNQEVFAGPSKRRAVLEAVLAHRIRKLRASYTSNNAQLQALLSHASVSKSDVEAGLRTPRSDSTALNLNEDEISSAGLSAPKILRGQLALSDKALAQLSRPNKTSAQLSGSKISLASSQLHDKSSAKLFGSEMRFVECSTGEQAVSRCTRDLQEDCYGSAPLRYLQQMSTGPPRHAYSTWGRTRRV